MRAEDPEKFIAQKKARFDSIFEKQYVSGQELTNIKESSGLLGLEPHQYNIGVVEPNNLTVNTRTFTSSLVEYMKQSGVHFHFCSSVTGMPVKNGRIQSITLQNGQRIEADDFVMAAGYQSVVVLKGLGIKLPLAAVKAYSLHISNAAVAEKIQYATHLEAGVA